MSPRIPKCDTRRLRLVLFGQTDLSVVTYRSWFKVHFHVSPLKSCVCTGQNIELYKKNNESLVSCIIFSSTFSYRLSYIFSTSFQFRTKTNRNMLACVVFCENLRPLSYLQSLLLMFILNYTNGRDEVILIKSSEF